jgi:hypothetical protein
MTTLRKLFLLSTVAAILAIAFAIPAASGKTSKSRPRCNQNSESIQTNLEGTYPADKFTFGNLTGNATLEIGPLQALDALKFNPFSITSDSTKLSGRVVAITTCGYTTATLFFDVDSSNKPLPDPTRVISLQVCKSDDQHSFSLNNATVSTTLRGFVFTSTSAVIADHGNWGRCTGRKL